MQDQCYLNFEIIEAKEYCRRFYTCMGSLKKLSYPIVPTFLNINSWTNNIEVQFKVLT